MAAQTKAVVIKEQKAIVQYKGTPITITFDDVKRFICPLATDQEVVIFLRTCQSLNLNVWADEIYLIKYSERDKAATVISIDSYLKAGEANSQFDGYESGIILKDTTGKLDFRDCAFLLDEERSKLVGGWAKVYRKDRSRPFYVAVNKKECIRYTRDGHLTQFWAEEKQPSMLRKVALKRALVEAFPSLFLGSISNVDVDYEVLPAEMKEALPKPKGETPEGELPPAYERNGEARWNLWWVRQKEKGLSEDDVHGILNVSSIKEDWIGKGRTLEEAEDIINGTLEKTAGTKPGPVIGETEEDLFPSDRVIDVSPESPRTPPKLKRDPETIKTINDLLKACNADYKMQPKEVYAELNVKSASEIKETPAESYKRIAAVRQ